jgi:hypothetical protein
MAIAMQNIRTLITRLQILRRPWRRSQHAVIGAHNSHQRRCRDISRSNSRSRLQCRAWYGVFAALAGVVSGE